MPPIAADLRVGDLMTIDPITVRIDASIEDAEDLMRTHRITGLPVIDPNGHLVGVISQTDLRISPCPRSSPSSDTAIEESASARS